MVEVQKPRGYIEGKMKSSGHNQRPTTPKPNFAPPPQTRQVANNIDTLRDIAISLFTEASEIQYFSGFNEEKNLLTNELTDMAVRIKEIAEELK